MTTNPQAAQLKQKRDNKNRDWRTSGVIPDEKTCTQCSTSKPLADFPPAKDGKYGRNSECRECHRKRWHSYIRRPEVVEANKKGRRNRSAYKQASLGGDPIKMAKFLARDTVRRAIIGGVLVKGDVCFDCGTNGDDLHGHHDDYNKPMEVVWLCAPCHSKRHYGIANTEACHLAQRIESDTERIAMLEKERDDLADKHEVLVRKLHAEERERDAAVRALESVGDCPTTTCGSCKAIIYSVLKNYAARSGERGEGSNG